MKKLIILSILLGVIFGSCKKENPELSRQNLSPITETINVSKFKLLSNGVTLLITFNDETGEVSITPEKVDNITINVNYKLFKETNGIFQPVSNMSPKYSNKFVINLFSTIPTDSNYKVEMNVQTSSGGNCVVTIEGKKK